MKEFKLAAWPELPPAFKRTVHRRMLSDLSHRYITEPQLAANSGATKLEVRAFLQMLGARGLLRSRDADSDGLLGPLGGWLKRTLGGDPVIR
jgi:hypothetical protein